MLILVVKKKYDFVCLTLFQPRGGEKISFRSLRIALQSSHIFTKKNDFVMTSLRNQGTRVYPIPIGIFGYTIPYYGNMTSQ